MKRRVHELAKELGLTSKDVLAELKAMKVDVSSHMSQLDESTANAVLAKLGKGKPAAAPSEPPAAKLVPSKPEPGVAKSAVGKAEPGTAKPAPISKAPGAPAPVKPTPPIPAVKAPEPPMKPAAPAAPAAAKPVPAVPEPAAAKSPEPFAPAASVAVKPQETPAPAVPVEDKRPVVKVSEIITMGDLAVKLNVPAGDLIKKMLSRGKFVTINQSISEDMVPVVEAAYGCRVELISSIDDSVLLEESQDEKGILVPRPPIVTIMGHVDHGKTSLLDAIRETNVTAREAGGITQHIGAYRVKLNQRYVTFIDTPGHEAFTRLRARGAQVTDVVVLVVAADDGVMPQTIEALNHAKAAGTPIIVAVNKMDKPDANPDRVKQQLAEMEVVPEDWGGKHIFVDVSAKKKTGLEKLLEMVLLEADLLELKACPTVPAKGTIVEAKLDKNRGPVATVLIQNGTLRVGDSFVSGATYGKVRAMFNDLGERVAEAGPATPVEVTGFAKTPNPGEVVIMVKDEKMARQIATRREEMAKVKSLQQRQHMSLEALYQKIQQGVAKQLSIIVKADAGGSIEALSQSLRQLSNDQVTLSVIHGGVGAINVSDVMLATASDAVIIGFHVKADSQAEELAASEGIEIKLYQIIYEVIADVKAAMEGLLEPVESEVAAGSADVRKVFKLGKSGVVLGVMVADGKLKRGDFARVMRGGQSVFEGKISSLKRFQDDVKEVAAGYECGVTLDGFDAPQEGDRIQAYTKESTKQTLQ